ncbi:hypothetical protein F4778DRAFT_786720 [Xylariomycetidae sp. FL2044]|nr:hypothetical protein F4778DRAFT_786720 [Xylariomycetidae sp. FL2044]
MSRMARHRHPHQQKDTRALSLSFTLALKDGALGTIPLTHQQPVTRLLKADAPYLAAAIPRILSAVLAAAITKDDEHGGWQGTRVTAVYITVSLLELQFVLAASFWWLFIPGFLLLPLLAVEALSIGWLVRRLNVGNQSCRRIPDPVRSEERDGDKAHLHWLFVAGMDLDHDQVRDAVIPKLAHIVGSGIHVFAPYLLGFPLDMMLLFVQRSISIPTVRSTALYHSIRAGLLDPGTAGIRIVAHNTGALDTAWVLSRLCSDISPGVLADKLQVFTFGAATAEMTLPFGYTDSQSTGIISVLSPAYPSVTHFAFEDDPFARIGVILGVRQRMEGRFVGSLYSIKKAQQPTKACWLWLVFRRRNHTLGDYLTALFPEGGLRDGVLGQVCRIDREVSEMRELAALAHSVNSMARPRRTSHGSRKRLSWTALGVLVNSMSGESENGTQDMAGVLSLDEVRRKGRALEGMRGYENNALVEAYGYYGIIYIDEARSEEGHDDRWSSQTRVDGAGYAARYT